MAAVPADQAPAVLAALQAQGERAAVIGHLETGDPFITLRVGRQP
ncbi:MAG: hypothetical protein ORN49_13950 [Rhodobacteraceae bacterium]|nr:hypothetical protein [Paracoccaceae bacterium]